MRSKLASSIAILLNYGAKWRVLYYIFYVLSLTLQLSIILDPHLLSTASLLTQSTLYPLLPQSQPILLAAILFLPSIFSTLSTLILYLHTPTSINSEWMAKGIITICTGIDWMVLWSGNCLIRIVMCYRGEERYGDRVGMEIEGEGEV
jgi:hypothetical protein